MKRHFSSTIRAINARFSAAQAEARRMARDERALARQRRAALARLESYSAGGGASDCSAAAAAPCRAGGK